MSKDNNREFFTSFGSRSRNVISSELLSEFERFKNKFNSSSLSAEALAETMGDVDKRIVNYAKTCRNGELTTSGFKNSIEGMSLSAKAGQVALKGLAMAGNMITMWAITEVVKGLYEMSKTSEKVASKASEMGSNFANTENDIESYKERISSLYETINNNKSSIQEVSEARLQLVSIQDELIDKYGSEQGAIENITTAINGQIDALNTLGQIKWQETLNEFNDGNIWNDLSNAAHGYKDNASRMLSEYGDYEVKLNFSNITTDANFEKFKSLLESQFNISFNNIGKDVVATLSGDATDVYNQLLSIQNIFDNFGFDSSFIDNQLATLANSTKIVSDQYKEMYDQYLLYEEIFKNAEYTKFFKDINDAYNKYNDAIASGNEEAINNAIGNYADVMKNIYQSVPENISDYFANMYPALQNVASEWMFKIDFEPNVNGLENKVKSYLKDLNGLSAEDIINFDYTDPMATDSRIKAYEGLISIANEYGISIKDLIGLLEEMGLVQSEAYQELSKKFGKDNIRTLTDNEIKIGYTIENYGDMTFDEFKNEIQKTLAENYTYDVKIDAEASSSLISNLNNIQSILSSSTTGKSLSLENYNSDELLDYQSAIEYVNGSMQLNAEKVNEIVQAKSKEQIAVNNTNKAYAQSDYLKNAAEIDRLRQKIRDNNFEQGENAEVIQASIDSYLKQNNSLLNTIHNYDLMNASIREATSAYQHWLNAQSAAQSGDMFDSSLQAFQKIEDTLNNTDSDSYGRIGNEDYKAAINFVIPDTIDKENQDAINAYMDSIAQYFVYDDNGNRSGLDISSFCQEAIKQDLMYLDEATDTYKILGEKTMEDFAEGLGLSLPLVQAMFGEMEEFGGKFDWADEADKTIGDLGVSATEAAEKLRSIDQFKDLKIQMDVSELSTSEEKLNALDATIAEMQGVKASVAIDSSEAEYANQVISYCITQKQMLSQPDVMQVDTSLVEGKIGEAIALFQEFQVAKEQLEKAQALGLDTSQAQADLDAVTQKIQGLDDNVTTTLSIDTSSVDTIQETISKLTCQMLVDVGINDTAIIGFQSEEHDAKGTVEWDNDTTIVDAYSAARKVANGTVQWYNDTTLVKTTFTATGTINWTNSGGGHSLNGTAHAGGTAKASGNWGNAQGGKTLVGELGPEIVVDPYTGKWYTVGDNGAEFRNIPSGAIVFNHLQSEAILKNGYINSRGKALINGSAMVTGGISVSQANKPKYPNSTYASSPSSNNNYNNSNSNSNSNSTPVSNKEAKDTADTLDWIETLLKRIQDAIESLGKKASSVFKTWKNRNSALIEQMKKVNEELALQEQAYNRYLAETEPIGLSDHYKELVRNGAIDIELVSDETLKENIQNFQTWYEKALECEKALEDLKETAAELNKTKFDNVVSEFEQLLNKFNYQKNMMDEYMNQMAAHGYQTSTRYYQSKLIAESNSNKELVKQRNAMLVEFESAMLSGTIEKGSEAWYDMANQIDEVTVAIEESHTAMLEYKKEIRDIEWGYFDLLQERITQITNEAEFLIDLMGNKKLYDDKGQLTDEGMATMGLYGQNYNVYMEQSKRYAEEIKRIDKELADDPYNQDLINRRNELLEQQREMILSAEQQKDAIVNLVKEGIELELESLKKLIDETNEALNSQKDLYDYQNRVRSQTRSLLELQKALSAYQGDDSEEAKVIKQQLQVNIEKAQQELQETEYDKYISDVTKLTSSLYDEYELILNSRMDNIDALVADMITEINSNASSINSTLEEQASSVGITLSSEMQDIWGGTDGIKTVLTFYGTDIANSIVDAGTTINSTLGTINTNLSNMIDQLNKIAGTNIKAAATSEAEVSKEANAQKPQPKPEPTPEPEPESKADFFIYRKSEYPKDQLNKDTSIVDRLAYHDYDWSFDARKLYYNKMGFSGEYVSSAEQNIGMLNWMKLNGYKKGLKHADKDEWAWTQEDGKPEVIIRPSDGSILTPVKYDDAILNSIATENIFEFANNPGKFIDNLGKSWGNSTPNILNSVANNNNAMNGDIIINMTNNLPNVKNAKEFEEQFFELLQNSHRAEKIVRSISMGGVLGHSRLDKYKYK